jgi:hypothetical protein
VLQHFHAGHHIKSGRLGFGQFLGGDASVIQHRAGFQLVQLSHRQRRFAHVNAQHLGAAQGHALGQNAAAAPDIQYVLIGQSATVFVNDSPAVTDSGRVAV